MLREVEKDHTDFKILDTVKSSGCFALVPKGHPKYMITKYRPLFYNGRKHKIIPSHISSGTFAVRMAFYCGAYSGDGSKCNNEPTKCLRYDIKGKTGAAQMFRLISGLGYNCSINDRKDKPLIFRITASLARFRKNPIAVKKVYPLGQLSDDEYVYDVETKEGAFQAGVGNLILKNTDSVMIKFGLEDLAKCMELGKEAAGITTSYFTPPIRLEFEKAYWPYLLISKKRYAGVYWTNTEKYDRLDTKGLETVRRDNCPIVRDVMKISLDKILLEKDLKGAEEYVKKIISDLFQNKIDLSQLIITKALSKDASEYVSKQAHAELASRMKKRDPSTAPNIGDRVPYVMIKARKGARAYEKSEDPLYVLENDIPLDFNYYLENQLKKPLTRLFKPIMENVQRLFSGSHTTIRCNVIPKTG